MTEFFGFETVDSIPCLYHSEMDMLVLSDLHLGLEGSITSEGAYVPRFQLDDILEDIETAREETGAPRILINGDLKNEFRKSYYSEKQEIKKFLRRMQKSFEEVTVVEGNHDTFIENTVEQEGLELRESYLEDGILFIHGHEDIETDKEFETIVIGHEHPALSLEDEIGVVEKVDCALYGETNSGKNIVVLPAFSSISNGTRINEIPESELLSPVLRERLNLSGLKAVAISREAGVFEFPEIGKI
ncbi:MAG: metallophosphoesterase [Candidatus Nanosalina sp.]